MEEANQMCDRVAIINKGKIEAIDTPEMLKTAIKKLQVIVVSFVGSNGDLTSGLKVLGEVTDIIKHGDKYRLNTENVPQALSNIWSFSNKKRLKINTLNTLSPTLEDVFVELTGIHAEIKPTNNQRG